MNPEPYKGEPVDPPSFYRILSFTAATVFLGYLAWAGDWYGSQEAAEAFGQFFYRAMAPVVALALLFWMTLSGRADRRFTGLIPPYPEIWGFVIVMVWKLLRPVGREIDDFSEFLFQHSILTNAGLVALVAIPAVMFRRPGRFLVLFLLAAEIAGLLIFDLVYQRHLAFLPSVADFQSRQAPLTAETFRSLLTLGDLVYLADLPVWAALFLATSPAPAEPVTIRFRSVLAGLLGAAVLCLPGTAVMARIIWSGHVNTALRGDAMAVNAVGLLGYHILDLHAFRETKVTPSPDEIDSVRSWFSDSRVLNRSAVFGRGEGMNLVLVSAEAVQDFVPGLVYRGQEITPHLNRFARESILRARLHDVTGVGRSSDADFAALHSLLPSPDRANTYRFSGNRFRGLPALLAECGYTTAAFVFAEGYLWNWQRFYPASGFQQAFFLSDLVADPTDLNALDDRQLFTAVLKRIEGRSESPFFFLVHTASTHHPFVMGQRIGSLDLGDLDRNLVGRYLRSLRYFDDAFGDFLKGLEERGIADRTVVAVFGDHDAGIYNEPGLEKILGYPVRDPVSRARADMVPFMVRVPGTRDADSGTARGSQVDIAPTLLAVMGIPTAGLYMIGRDLTADREGLVVFANGSAASDSRLYLTHSGRHPGAGCFRLESGEELAVSACGDMATASARIARISHLVVRGDLVPAGSR